jgi:hypothetical protein
MAASQGQYRRFLGRAIDVEGENGGFAAVERATSDLRSAIDGADVIIGGPVKDFNGVSGIGPRWRLYCLVGGVGSRTGAGLSLARIALSVLIAQAGQKGDPGLASAGNLANVG